MDIQTLSGEFPEEIWNLQIPSDERARQAVDSLRGYGYQIYQTLDTWLTLNEGEILLLEVAEDFAVITKNALKATQVKDTAGSGSVTLNTESVSKTIKSLWDFQKANPDRNVYITYLTTAKIGKEQGLIFPDNHTGLTYWRVAAREGTEVEPLRKGLLCLNLPPDLTDFIKHAKADELREKILHQISWVCGEKNIKVLDQAIRDRLVYLGEPKGITPTDSEKARDSLIAEILTKIGQKSGRQLSRADLLRIFEKATSISLPKSQIRGIMASMQAANQGSPVGTILATDLVLNATGIPLPPRILDRRILVEKIISEMGQSGSLWLHGSSGTGKTVLTQFIARQSNYSWLIVPLRDCTDASELDFRLCRVLQTLSLDKIGGVILDDFPTQYANRVRLRLSMLADEVNRMDGSVIVTSAKPPSPNAQGCFGEGGPTVVKIPYLSREEVSELVKLAGGDAQKWAGVVHVFCGLGHPQLVQARISGLQQRNWPSDELIAGIPGIGLSVKEIEEEHDSVRERLLVELPSNARSLLYRLNLLAGYFDRELAIAIGEVDADVSNAGEALDILIGPWVEAMAQDRFRVSPLVSGMGNKMLSKPAQIIVHQRIVNNLITRNPFPADFLGSLLSHALTSQHEEGLTRLTVAIMNTSNKDRIMMAEQLLLLQLIDKSKPIFKENIDISAMLRLTQFRVCAWANKTESLPVIADQLLVEVGMLDNKEIADGFHFLAIITILVEQSLRISPQKWIPLLGEAEEALSGEGQLAQMTRTLNLSEKCLENWTIPQFLFAVRATSLRNIDELVELFLELNQMTNQRRAMLLSSLSDPALGIRTMIDSAWLAELREGKIDGVVAAEKFGQLTNIAEKWNGTDIGVGLECARAVMLDEYAEDSKGALASLDNAEKKYPSHVRLLRQRASVHFRSNDHPTALAIIEQIADILPKEDRVERTFVLREAGISAAETGDLDKANYFFSKASEAASGLPDNIRPMAIGLVGDQAIVQFRLGNKREALNLMRQAIIDAEQLDPKTGKNEKYCIHILVHAILWMQEQVKNNSLSETDSPIITGCCSNPEPSERIMEMMTPPILFHWYQLAFLEVIMGLDANISDELRKRRRTQRILSCELLLNYHLMAKHITNIDMQNFFSYLPEFVSKAAYMKENSSKITKENMCDLTGADLPEIKPVDWASDLHLEFAKDALLTIAAVAICSNIKNIKELLLNHARHDKEVKIALQGFIDCFEMNSSSKDDFYDAMAFYIGCFAKVNTNMSPANIFIVTYSLWDWLRHTSFKDIVEDRVANLIVRRWQMIIKHQKFSLQQPMISIPAIKAVINDSSVGTVKIARLLLAAEIAVNSKLNTTQRSQLHEHCSAKD